MANLIKLRKGLTINLAGAAAKEVTSLSTDGEYALVPDDFVGVKPKVVVKPGDTVKAGDFLFVNKNAQQVGFASPVSGTVTDVLRGDRRKVLSVKVKADKEQVFKSFEPKDVDHLTAEQVINSLLEAGLFGYIEQMPYAVSTTPNTKPAGIFVSALRDMPLQADFDFTVKGNEAEFQAGITALSKIAPVYLGIGSETTNKALTDAKDAEVTIFSGKCPAGNVDVQINHTHPVCKGEVVWTVDPDSVVFFGRLFLSGKVNLTKTIAVAGSEINEPAYLSTLVGTPISRIVNNKLKHNEHVRVINGNPLTGEPVTDMQQTYLGAHRSEVTAIPEGDNANELLGWIRPRTNEFSVSHSYFSWLFGKKKQYVLDARIKGGERHMIMSGEYDKVLPMDIYAEYLIKAIITGDIDKQEQLGIYEVRPEDFALAEFVDSSKLPLQQIVRNGLDILRKENA